MMSVWLRIGGWHGGKDDKGAWGSMSVLLCFFCNSGWGSTSSPPFADPGWTFKNSMSIHQSESSHYTFLSLIVTILDLLDKLCDHSRVGGATIFKKVFNLHWLWTITFFCRQVFSHSGLLLWGSMSSNCLPTCEFKSVELTSCFLRLVAGNLQFRKLPHDEEPL